VKIEEEYRVIWLGTVFGSGKYPISVSDVMRYQTQRFRRLICRDRDVHSSLTLHQTCHIAELSKIVTNLCFHSFICGLILSVENRGFRRFDWLIAKFSHVQRLF
jgi:hypothetical protein